MKPTPIARLRRRFIRSPRMRVASSAVQIGMVNSMANTSVNGMCASP